jgi:hypothetical protein
MILPRVGAPRFNPGIPIQGGGPPMGGTFQFGAQPQPVAPMRPVQQFPAKPIGSFKKGGKVKRAGRYTLHEGEQRISRVKKTAVYSLDRGERVIPKGKTGKLSDLRRAK